MPSFPRRYWPAVPIAAVFAAGVFFEWSHARGPQQPSYAAAPQIPAAAASQPPTASGPNALPAQQTTTKESIIGTWKVLSLKGLTAGLVKYPLGEKPAGYVTVTATRMWLLFVDSRRPAPASAALSDPEAIVAMKTSIAWTGQYTINEQSPDGLKATVQVDTASSPALPGTDRVYLMKVEGNRLTMKSLGVIEPMTGVTSALVIELAKAE
jgi:hypothetical protein